MATVAQINAAVANAQLSTGPRTIEGKAVSSKNATKLGLFAESIIIPGEDPADFEKLAQQFDKEYAPGDNATGIAVVENLVRAIWMQRRYLRIQSDIIKAYSASMEPGAPFGRIFIDDANGPKLIEKVSRRQQAADRNYYLALRNALDWRNARRTEEMLANGPLAGRTPAPNPVRSDKPEYPPYTGGPTPVRTPRDNWDNPALRL